MIGTFHIDVLMKNKEERLLIPSTRFASLERPNFQILREAALCLQIIIKNVNEGGKHVQNMNDIEVTLRSEKKFLFELLSRCAKSIGTNDDEWYTACEASLNALFLLKSR